MWSAIITFIQEGVRHVLEGWDHVLFVLCLTLGATRLKSLVWRATGFTIGHTVTLIVGFFGFVPSGHALELKQFHFHAPSENHVQGPSFPMEVHLVHADAKGDLAVVAVLFDEGAANAAIEFLWKLMPERAGNDEPLSKRASARDLLPADKSYYRINGSLTTPPCTEGVWWLVMKQCVSVSDEQVERFSHVIGHSNNRPLQEVNARPVLR